MCCRICLIQQTNVKTSYMPLVMHCNIALDVGIAYILPGKKKKSLSRLTDFVLLESEISPEYVFP